MGENLLELLRQQRVDELLRHLDQPEQRERLIAALEGLEEAPQADAALAFWDGERVDCEGVWQAAAQGQALSGAAQPVQQSYELARALGAAAGRRTAPGRISWGQVAAAAALGAVAAIVLPLVIPLLNPGLGQRVYPEGMLLALAEQQVLPELDARNRGELARFLDSYERFEAKAGTTPVNELYKLLLIYQPTTAELEQLRQVLGLAGQPDEVQDAAPTP